MSYHFLVSDLSSGQIKLKTNAPSAVGKTSCAPGVVGPHGRSQQSGLDHSAGKMLKATFSRIQSLSTCVLGTYSPQAMHTKIKERLGVLTSDGRTVKGGPVNSSSPLSHTCQVPQRSNARPIPGLALTPKLLGQLSLNTLCPCWLFLAAISHHFLQYLTCRALSPNLC